MIRFVKYRQSPPVLAIFMSVNPLKERYDQALDAVQRALDIDPKMVHSWVVRGNILTRAQRNE